MALSCSRLVLTLFTTLEIASLFGAWSTPEARAQSSMLPKGIGLYQFGYRQIPALDSKFGPGADVISLGADFDLNFAGPAILGKDYGKDLQRLGTVLKEYEGGAAGPGTLLGDLDLGRLDGDVVAKVDAKIFALGFGVHERLMLFAGIPYITASVKTELSFSGGNNALQILERLGNASFDELREGLTKASRLSIADIEQNIADNGYQPVDEWTHSGVGDLRLGAKTGLTEKLSGGINYSLDLTTALDLPTGYVERPDVLTDINFGKSYTSLTILAENTFTLNPLLVGFDATLGLNFNTELEKRLPETNESTIAKERTTKVTLNPGDDLDWGASLAVNFWWLTPKYRVGMAQHFADRYSGKMQGNYKELAADSDSSKLYHEFMLNFETTKAYARKAFPVPLIITAKAQIPVDGKNTPVQKFYELSLSSFFSTPMADQPNAEDSPRSPRT
jgi:hypothetical protein